MNAAAIARRLGPWRQQPRAPGADLEQALRDAILLGRIPVGARLPSERSLAAALGISRGTVSATYSRLRGAGWLCTRTGSGSTTALPAGLNARMAFPGGWRARGGESAALVDLTYAAPIAPLPEYLRALAVASERLRALAVQPVVGELAELQETIAGRYSAAGLATSPAQVLITSGASAGLAFALADTAPPGSRVLVEAPTYPGALEIARQHGAQAIGWPVLDGWDRDVFAHMADRHRVRAAYVTFDFHNPTGALAGRRERDAVLAAAGERGVSVIVDETLRDLAFSAEDLPPVTRGAALHIGSLSKSVWAGLGVGWVRAQERVADRLRSQPLAAALVPPPLEQLIALELLPRLDAIAAQRRPQLRGNLALVASAVEGWQGAALVGPPRGGLSAWVRLPASASATWLVRRPARRGGAAAARQRVLARRNARRLRPPAAHAGPRPAGRRPAPHRQGAEPLCVNWLNRLRLA